MEISSLEPGDEETLEDIYRLLNRAYRNCRPWCHVTCQGLVLVVRQLASRFRVLIGTQWYIDFRQDGAHVLADNSWRGSITHSYTYEYNHHFLFSLNCTVQDKYKYVITIQYTALSTGHSRLRS